MVHIYASLTSPRLNYVLGVIFRDHLRVAYRVYGGEAGATGTAAAGGFEDYRAAAGGAKIAYSAEDTGVGLWIPASRALELGGQAAEAMRGAQPLSASGDGAQPLSPSRDGAQPGGGRWPFDLFGAVFFLISRFEEYLPTAPYDSMGRYDPEGSWAARNGFLERPLVDEWIAALGRTLGLTVPAGARLFPTYDIDQPWCYKHKSLILLSALRSGRLGEAWKVLYGRARDPFDNFHWMDSVNAFLPEAPVYFFPLSARRTGYDKNPPPGLGEFQELIRTHSKRYPVGIHPSFYSRDTDGLLSSEIDMLTRITDLPVTISRFHYIRFRLPSDYRLLLSLGIRADYSMGYGERNGFRASYSRPFAWYDLLRENETSLQVVPFCWMEATSYHVSRLSAEGALAELLAYKASLDAVGGRFTPIWHNNSLGVDVRWIGWRKVYYDFLKTFVPTLPL